MSLNKNNGHISNKNIAVITLLCMSMLAPAYAAVPPPNSGTALEGVKPPAVQAPAQRQAPSVTVEGEQPALPNDSLQTIKVSGFRLSGELPVPENELLQLIRDQAGKELTLSQLNKLAGKMTAYLRQQGYLVAFAYIPAQTINDGIVEITVVPGTYGRLTITGEGLGPEQLRQLFSAAKSGTVITREPLERALLLAGDLSGVTVKATLTPGKEAGTADLALAVSRTDNLSGSFYADNWGNRYSGKLRSGVQLSVNNPSNRGDQLTLGGLLTESSRLDDYSLSYNTPLGSNGMRLALSHARLHYTLGETYEDLGASGKADTDSVSLSYPLMRGRTFNLNGTLGYDHKRLHDDVAASDNYSRKTSGMWNVGLSGSFIDTWLGGGSNRFALTQYWGRLCINDTDTAAIDDMTTHTAGHFNKTVLNFERQQAVAQNLNFHFTFTGQLASKNLDSSGKLFLGGADGVRAYPQGEASGDQGCLLSGELLWRMPGLSTARDSVYLTSFYDYGTVMVNKNTYDGSGDNRCSLEGAGLGLLWNRNKDFALRMDYAWKLGQEAASSDTDKNGRFWIQGVKYF